MIVGIVGIETLDVQSDKIQQWILEKIADVLLRAKNKGCTAIITSDLLGVDRESINIARSIGLDVIMVSDVLLEKPGYVNLQFFTDHSFIGSHADYCVIIENGQTHSRLDSIKESSRKALIINYLEKSERWL